jgi:endo-1,4-beta-D-glucanase Y
MALRAPWVLSLIVLAACPGGTLETGDSSDVDDGPDDVDAGVDPGRSDADPAAPDADPAAPDAAVIAGEPDAGPIDPPACSDGLRVPFRSHAVAYAAGVIKPSNHSQSQLDQATADFYWEWKSRYLKDGCGSGRSYVDVGLDNAQTVSEAHGYGMLIAVLFAGEDPDARNVFDRLFRYFEDHPSELTPGLMSWSQDSSCQNNQGANSAADGDLDIALALLMADQQWGSGGAINYRAEADKVIDAIREAEIDGSGRWVLMGDWVQFNDDAQNATRSSDFMPGHFVSFAEASGDGAWTTVTNFGYGMFQTLQAQYAGSTGLLPDFVVSPAQPAPAPAGFLEGANDGRYHYNACRDPWRLGSHFVTSGDSRAKGLLDKLSSWAKSSTGGEPADIKAGYSLAGQPSPGSSYLSMAFVAPFGVGAMVNSSHQSWLNTLWNLIDGTEAQLYYDDSIKLLSMVVMSGNWWTPEDVNCD